MTVPLKKRNVKINSDLPRYVLSGSYDGSIALTCVEQVLLNPDLACTEIIGTHRDKVTNTVWHPTKQVSYPGYHVAPY